MSRIVHTSRSLALLAGLVMFGGVAVAPAMAATITYKFDGTVTFVGSNLTPPTPAPFNTSGLKNMTGTMTVDMSPAGTSSTPNSTTSTYTIQTFSLTVGNYDATFNSGGGNTVTIRNGTGGGVGADRFLVSAGVDGDDLGNPARDPRVFTINLRGPNNIFTSDALPTSSPNVGSFITNGFRLQFGTGNGAARAVIGTIDTLTAVPLPPAVILFGLGLVALIGLGAGGLRNLRLPQA